MTNDTPAAPAPEPWAWGWEDVTRDGREYRCATPDLTMVPSYVTDKGLIPLYTHPAPVAAPAPDADAIMALADTVAFRCDRYGINHAGQARELLRAAVEQLVRERDDDRERVIAAEEGWNADVIQLTERAERAEQDAKRWNAIKPYFRVMSPNIDGQHYWALRGGLPRGANMDEVADAALKEAK